MPGRLIMDQEGASGSQDLKKDRSHAQQSASQSTQLQDFAQPNGQAHHGVNGILPNGVPGGPHDPATTNGESSSTAVALSDPSNPPPLDQSWREGPNNKSLGLLMDRVAQQCYFDLNGTLTQMSEIPADPQPQQANGVALQDVEDTSDASIKKKNLLLDFASTQRDRFIKTLVLADWCRNEEEKSRLVDVKVWQDKQQAAYRDAALAIARTKENMVKAKKPNPNIEGAMEVLATGKASWIPDLGYIPPKRLSAKQLLKTLQGMNVALATRLSLHDELPPYMGDYSVADGRVTFRVQDEFEVDLSVAEEDPGTPFYFIDIRLAFRPTSNFSDERLRGFMERKVNHELATKGLTGCYSFLHSFVLTHKINVLRTQAVKLIREKWFDCIRVEKLRRVLVVQYWAGMPGPKSWIEIGIASGKQTCRNPRRPPNSHHSVRWFRKGVQVTEHGLEFDWQDIDLQKCLSLVISRHIAWVMKGLQQRIRDLAPAGSPFAAELSRPDGECDALTLALPSLPQPLRISIEQTTGQLSITPPSPVTLDIERRLNGDPQADAAKWLASLAGAVVQGRVRKEAELLGWVTVTGLLRQDNVSTLFGERVPHLSIFRPSKIWDDRWALVVTFGLAGEKYWVAELEEKWSEQLNLTGKVIATARPVSLPEAESLPPSVSRQTLLQMENMAVAELSWLTQSKQLQDKHTPYSFENVAEQTGDRQAQRTSSMHSLALFVRFSELMQTSQDKVPKQRADDLVRVTHHGVVRNREKSAESTGKVRYEMRLSLSGGKMKELQKHLAHSKGRDLLMNASGGLALRFLTPFGQPFLAQMQQRLRDLDRLDRYLAILKHRHFNCTHIDSNRLAFTYNASPELSAALIFPDDGEESLQLKFHPAETNPHQRLRVMLERGLNETEDRGFEALTFVLPLTLPVLQAFGTLETKVPAKRLISIHPRTATWYKVRYWAPLPSCTFELKSKSRKESEKNIIRWLISDLQSAEKDESLPDDLGKALKQLWAEKGEHWEGLGNGIIADAQGIAAALEKVDEVIRQFEGDGQKQPDKQAGGAEQPSSEQATKAPETDAPPTSQDTTQRTNNAGPTGWNKQGADVITLD